jgi:hypothetical protein
MRLQNADRAVLDIGKLENYCLDETHPLGRHKARVFRSALGVGVVDARWLREAILRGILVAEAQPLESDRFGTRYGVDLLLQRQGREAMVRTAWILAEPANLPRFVTCWVL